MNSIKEYFDIIDSFVGYDIVPRITSKTGQLFIRHDVDMDLDLALSMAQQEQKRGIRAVYFILLTGSYYNPAKETINEILGLGHDVLLHYDPLRYSNATRGLNIELSVFEKMFGIECDLISLHRPAFMGYKFEIQHTYSKPYARTAKYFSDSNCLWRYGYPGPQEGLRTVQLVTHPIWWVLEGGSEAEKCDNFMVYRQRKLKEELHKSLRTYV